MVMGEMTVNWGCWTGGEGLRTVVEAGRWSRGLFGGLGVLTGISTTFWTVWDFSLWSILLSFYAAFGFACHCMGEFRFKMLLHVGKHEDTQPSLLTLFSFHLSYLSKKYMIGTPLPLVVPLFYPLLECSTSLLKVPWIFQEYKLLYVPNIKFAQFFHLLNQESVGEMITIQNGL